ncbi:MAG: cobalamin biosynthesis protein CobD [Desulfuromusa sp.]|nr:cobalamin biosynthesis protein CobD [Desulfuromusa sp.]
MISLSTQVLLALLLDFLIGDPRWFPHPVKGIGWLAMIIEEPLRLQFSPRNAGIIAVTLVVLISTLVAWFAVAVAALIHPLAGDLVTIFILFTCFAMEDLRHHARAVYYPLMAGDLSLSRERVAMLVGRDTADLDEAQIARATVESVAENSVDGVTAPLLFAFIAGAPGAIFYKAVNTLDSTYGYKNDRYLQFGWAAARFDDLINFFPARITAMLVPLAAWLARLNGQQAWQIFLRDRHNHPSPNGGQTEAAFAGALGVQLGGVNYYGGKLSNRPLLGDDEQLLKADHIKQAICLMVVTSLIIVVSVIGLIWVW